MLCSNRAESFSTHSALSSPIPTSCFVDVILVPLPVWIALAALVGLLAIPSRHFGEQRRWTPDGSSSRLPQRSSWLYRIVSAIYYILIICNILMHTLEIVRLSLIHFGIGLLPFAYVGLILATTLHWSRGASGRISVWPLVNMIIWLGGMTMSIIKVVGLHKEGDPRKGSKYPMSDQILDVAVIAGVYAVLAILEAVTGLWRRRNTRLSKQ